MKHVLQRQSLLLAHNITHQPIVSFKRLSLLFFFRRFDLAAQFFPLLTIKSIIFINASEFLAISCVFSDAVNAVLVTINKKHMTCHELQAKQQVLRKLFFVCPIK